MAKNLWGSADDRGLGIDRTADGGLILSGHTKSVGKGGNDGWVIKTDSVGDVRWQKTYGTPRVDCGAKVYLASNGGYIMSHCIDTVFNAGEFNLPAYLAMLDDTGAVIWRCFFHGVEDKSMFHFRETSKGDFIVAGTVEDTSNSLFGWLAKVSSSGSILWERRYKYTGSVLPPQFADSYFYDVQEAPDHGFILSGFAFHDDQDIWIVKLDSMGCLTPGCITSDEAIDITPQYLPAKLYPNPFSDLATLEVNLQNRVIKTALCKIYDAQGKLVCEIDPESVQQQKVSFKIRRKEWASGAYFYKVVSNSEVLSVGNMVIR